MKNTLFVTALILSAAVAHAQSMSGMQMKPSASSSASQPAMPLVDAEVKKIDLQKNLIVLKHGDIPNLGMPAMTMGFDVADKKMLKGLNVGQKVQFQAAMVGGKATVTELKTGR